MPPKFISKSQAKKRLPKRNLFRYKFTQIPNRTSLTNIKHFEFLVSGILHHHEYYNGKRAPNGLRGEEIPLIARIIAVADAYDAMTSERPYRKGLSHEKAVAELKRCSGTQFDPKVVDAFLSCVKNEPSQIRDRLLV